MDSRQIWFNRHGEPIDRAAANDLLADADYKRVALTEITSGSDPNVKLTVSTVWLGVDHNWGDGPPILFETVVFGIDDEYMERYGTETEACEGHSATVTVVAATVPDAQIAELDAWPKG